MLWGTIAHPAFLVRPIKERYYNGHEFALIHYISKNCKKKHICFWGYLIFRFLCLSFPIWFLIGVFVNKFLIWIMFTISFLCFIYRSFFRGNALRIFRILKREYGPFKLLYLFPFAVFVTSLGRILDDYGFLRGLCKYFNKKISDRISGNKILSVIANIWRVLLLLHM